MEILTILCIAFFCCALLVIAVKIKFPKRGAWERLGDAIMMVLIAGGLFLSSSLSGFFCWINYNETSIWIKAISIICAIPGIGSLLVALRLFSK